MSDMVLIPTKNISKERSKAVRILSDIMGKGGDSRRLFYII